MFIMFGNFIYSRRQKAGHGDSLVVFLPNVLILLLNYDLHCHCQVAKKKKKAKTKKIRLKKEH